MNMNLNGKGTPKRIRNGIRTAGSLSLVLLMLLGTVACAKNEAVADMALDIQYALAQQSNAVQMAAEAEMVAADATDDQASDSEYIAPEDYGKIIENPFVSTAEYNVSTFSADVDTASYTYFRKLMSYGWGLEEMIREAGSSIRTEEMINYFDYDYAEPIDGMLFGIKSQIGPCPWNEDAVLLQLGLKADDAVTAAGNNLVFLIDVSGSMQSEDKMPLLKTAFTYLTETLSSDDVVSIVTYAGNEAVVLEGCKGTYTNRILRAVDDLRTGGSTNGEAGLRKAYEIAAQYYIEGGNNRIILASDGDLNVGMQSPEELKRFVADQRDRGIYLTTLGFGTGNYRDANMEALADHGNGVYHYIDGVSEAEKIFGTDLLSTLYTVAEDVKLQLTFHPKAVLQYRLVGYENRLLNEEDFADDTKDAGEVGAGHTVTVCYELILTEEAKSAPVITAADLDIRYKHPGEDESRLISGEIDVGTSLPPPEEEFAFIAAVVEFSMLLHESEYTDQDSLQRVHQTLQSLTLDDPYQREFRELVSALAN